MIKQLLATLTKIVNLNLSFLFFYFYVQPFILYLHIAVNNNNAIIFEVRDFSLFPKSIGDIVDQFKIRELKLSLSQGPWKYQQWGLPSDSMPTGGELWSLFDESLTSDL